MSCETDLLDGNILLSIVVVIVSDTINREIDPRHLIGCLEKLQAQVDAPEIEIIVPYPAHAFQIEALKSRFPLVTYLPVFDLKSYSLQSNGREHHDELRARGLMAAKGQIVALIEDYGRPAHDWSQKIIEAHRENFPAIGGAIENEIDRSLNWAVYYCDFGRYQNPIIDGPSNIASDANISYKASALVAIRSQWQETYRERVVNGALINGGHQISLSPEIILFQHRSDLRFKPALQERFVWGSSYAAIRRKHLSLAKRLLYIVVSPVLPFLIVPRMTAIAIRKRRDLRPFIKALPAIFALTMSWSFGELVGYIRRN